MIVLTEQIEIPASYEKLKAWTANFEEEFVKWSPYHIECNLYNGKGHLPHDGILLARQLRPILPRAERVGSAYHDTLHL